MSIDLDRERLLQVNKLEQIRRNPKATDMIPVYRWVRDEKYNYTEHFFLCALIPPNQVERMLSDTSVDNFEADALYGMPSAFESVTENGKREIRYHRYGVENGFEPLVIHRSFPGMKSYYEISEEFRHFHDLYHDKETDEYIKIDSDGNKEIVAVVKPDDIKIRLKEIRQFLAVKEMYLSILFEFNEYSDYSVQELELSKVKTSKVVGLSEHKSQPDPSAVFGDFQSEDLLCWTYSHVDTPGLEPQSGSRLRGRKLIKPLPKSKSGFGDFAEKSERYAEFIVDIDDNGDEVLQTCNPYKLNDFPIKIPDPAWSLNPVHFRKQVLEKYYNEPSKYSVEDSIIRCHSFWSMKIDNHDPDKVCVILKDLHHLPYREQQYWVSYNILPEGGVSETFFRRTVKGEWASSDQPDILFKRSYERLQKACDEYLGWQLLKPLKHGDEYRLHHMRIPTVEEESHFKGLVSDLSSILIERLNEKSLKDLIPVNNRKEIKRGINLLEYVLDSRNIKDTEKHIIFLRSLWDLRTTRSSAHPEILDKKEYERAAAYFALENLNRREAFAKILGEAVELLDFLSSVVRSGILNPQNSENH